MPWRGFLLACLVTGPLMLALALAFGRDPHAVPSVLVDRPAPDFSLPALDGEVVSLRALRGRPVVVNFWATWCLPCQSEHPMLQQAAAAYAGRAFFVGIVYQDEVDAVRRSLQQAGSNFPQLVDVGSKVAIDFGVAGVPESFILDAHGTIVHKASGVLTPRVLRDTLDGLLADATALDPGLEVNP